MVRSKSEVVIANLLYQCRKDFVKKMELYATNNIVQEKEFLITYETAGAPLSVSVV